MTAGQQQEAEVENVNVLFVCSRNQWRSPTAQWVFRNEPGLSVRSGGTSPRAKRTISVGDIRWADVILVMESKHKSRLRSSFRRSLGGTPIHVLDIADDYGYKDPELIAVLHTVVPAVLGW
jgi:predicted protein tyrosine phosphatase